MTSFWVIPFICLFGFIIWKKRRRKKQVSYIESYNFPQRVTDQLLIRYPHLTEADCELVLRGLRQYFQICRRSSGMVAMPSQVVDVAWHEFILFTRHYEQFCKRALGRFLHHTPTEAMSSRTNAQDSIKQAWRLACQNESIDPKNAHRLPLLFALDAQLKISDGFKYQLNCDKHKADGYCASHIGCGGSGCGGDSSDCGGDCGGD